MAKDSEMEVYCCTCRDFVPVKRTKSIGTEKDMQGRDLMTFNCLKCKQENKGIVRAMSGS
jgi:hypothetical protein